MPKAHQGLTRTRLNMSCHARGTGLYQYALTVCKQLSNSADCCFPPSENYISLFYFLLLLSPSSAAAEYTGVQDCGNEHLPSSAWLWQLFLVSVSPTRNSIRNNSPLKLRWKTCTALRTYNAEERFRRRDPTRASSLPRWSPVPETDGLS